MEQPSSESRKRRRESPNALPPSPTENCGINCSTLDVVSQALYTGAGETSLDGSRTCVNCNTELPSYQFAPIQPWSDNDYLPSECCIICRLHTQIINGVLALKKKNGNCDLTTAEKNGLRLQQLRDISSWHRCLLKNSHIFVPHSVIVEVSTSVIEHEVFSSTQQVNSIDMEQNLSNSLTSSPLQQAEPVSVTPPGKAKERAISNRNSAKSTKAQSAVPQPSVRATAEKARRSIIKLGIEENEDDAVLENSALKELKTIFAEQKKLYDRALGHVVLAQSEHESLRRKHLNASDMYDKDKWGLVNNVSREQAHTKLVLDAMKANFDKASKVIRDTSLGAVKGGKKR